MLMRRVHTPTRCSRWRGQPRWADLDPETGPRRAHAPETQRAESSTPPRSGYRGSVRSRVCLGPAACSPRSCHGAAPREGPRGTTQGPWRPHGSIGGEARSPLVRRGLPWKGRMGSFWVPLRLEGKLRPGIVPSPTFIQFSQQLQ